MKVIIAKEAGFCFGVKRALNLITRLHEQETCIQIYGQLIHNRSVLENLEKKGIKTITQLDGLDKKKKLAIRTHGIPKDTESYLKQQGIDILDATCPLVKKIHHIIEKIDHQKNRIVFVGDRNHPEVIAATSYAPADSIDVIHSLDEARQFPAITTPNKPATGAQRFQNQTQLSVIAQTTLDADFFQDVISILSKKTEKMTVYDTICQATKERQDAIKELAPKVDCVVVVGGKNSSNTRKLVEIAVKRNQNTFHIESSRDLEEPGFFDKIKSFQSVGITGGASTPPDEINKVKIYFKSLEIDNPEKE